MEHLSGRVLVEHQIVFNDKDGTGFLRGKLPGLDVAGIASDSPWRTDDRVVDARGP